MNPESIEIEDPEELEKMEEMWSKMFQRIVDEGKWIFLSIQQVYITAIWTRLGPLIRFDQTELEKVLKNVL